MNHDEAFLQDILERPEEDAPRLVYADWLDDQGRATQAELIRVQIELARLPDDQSDRRALLQGRERYLLARVAKGAAGRWLRRALPRAKGAPAWELQRGAIERVSITVPRLLHNSEQLFRRFPIRCLRLTELQGLDGLASWPHIRRLRELELVGHFGGAEDAVVKFFRSAHFPALKT